MPRRPRVSSERILAAAAAEFAARGFAGARVDRIARRARVNKAMLYYHFGSKQALYRALLRSVFAQAAGRLEAVADGGDGNGHAGRVMMDRAIATLADLAREHSYLPAVMLREIAEGGTHLDNETLAALSSVPAAFARVLRKGVDGGVFRPVHPVAAYFSVVAPLMMFLAAAPIRQELSRAKLLLPLATLPPEAFVAYLQDSTHRALAAHPSVAPSTAS